MEIIILTAAVGIDAVLLTTLNYTATAIISSFLKNSLYKKNSKNSISSRTGKNATYQTSSSTLHLEGRTRCFKVRDVKEMILKVVLKA